MLLIRMEKRGNIVSKWNWFDDGGKRGLKTYVYYLQWIQIIIEIDGFVVQFYKRNDNCDGSEWIYNINKISIVLLPTLTDEIPNKRQQQQTANTNSISSHCFKP